MIATALVIALVLALLTLGAAARPAAPSRGQRTTGTRRAINRRLQDPTDNFPQDDSREDMRAYRKR